VLLYHNVTPPEYFAGWDDDMARICRVGREELATLAGHCDLGLADSEWNRRELEALGVTRTGVLPICLDFARYREAPNPVLRRVLEDGRTNLLFVGRLVPNKKPEDLIRLASCWKRFVSPDVRLVLVGKPPRSRGYFDALQALAYEEGFTPEEVVFAGHVAHDELLACYAAARVFVSMSEHEGFGVPLVESMLTRVPVLAYAATAVPYTLGGAGVQFTEKRFAEVTETAHALATDEALRAQVLAGQDRRLAAFEPARVLAALRERVESP
jgi:glycosyltransferase involved in cell wall biosynthesis